MVPPEVSNSATAPKSDAVTPVVAAISPEPVAGRSVVSVSSFSGFESRRFRRSEGLPREDQ
jgi:hypothetical protein